MVFHQIKKIIPEKSKKYLRYLYSILPIKYQFGKTFWKTYHFLKESQWWSRTELESYQMQQLEKLLNHAYLNVPYYRKLFDERGLKPKDIQNLNDLKRVPFLTKEIIKQNTNDLTDENFPRSEMLSVSTSGTTGGPMKFYVDKYAMDREWAFMLAQWERVGFELGAKRVILRGGSIKRADKGKFWDYSPKDRSLTFSIHRMNNESLPAYLKKIKEFRPQYIHAYPSSITILANWMKENNESPFECLKAILCGSENFYNWQRQLLENVFQCRVFSWYGHSEQAVLGGECEYSSMYHMQPEYGITELIEKEGNYKSIDDDAREIAATGFNNFLFPFIRYKTGDIGRYSEKECSCGRQYSLINGIEGRVQDFFVSRNGHLIPFSGYYLTLKVSNQIEKFQYYQDRKGMVVLKIVRKEKYTDNDTKKIKKELDIKYGDNLDFRIDFVDDITRSESGKYKYLVQKLPVNFGQH
jgi:phenylacetate-CoA ligase